MKSKNKIIKIIFNISGRTKFLKRYLKLLSRYKEDISFDLLIINQMDTKILNPKFSNLKILNIIYKDKINGMNDIFRAIYKSQKFIKNYKYCCFVEDDNFIFPKSLINAEFFLDNNSDFIACSGNKFLFSKNNKKNYYYLNKYQGPTTNSSNKVKQRFENYNGAICFYSLIRQKFFIKILKSFTKIKDDNMSEILFNYLTIKYGKINKLNDIYLAREYPRPQIYNIPSKTKWFINNNLFKDIFFVMKSIDKNLSDELLDISIYKYLSSRLKKNRKVNFIYTTLNLFKKFNFYFINYYIVNNFIQNLNKK